MALADLNPFAGRKKVKLTEGILGTLGDSVEFDASVDEDHTGENEVTDFPVEEGANVTDHSRPKPRLLTVHGFITGTPVSLLNIATPPSFKATRGKDAWHKMEKWRTEGTRISIVTTLVAYTSVLITRLSVPRKASNSDGIEFTISFKELRTVSSRLVPKPTRPTKPPSSKVGGQPTKDAEPPVEEKSSGILKSFSDAVGRKLGVGG